MGHYCCKECGSYGCFGECMTPEDHARRNEEIKEQKERAAQRKIEREAQWEAEAKATLDEELERRKKVSNAMKTLVSLGKLEGKYKDLL